MEKEVKKENSDLEHLEKKIPKVFDPSLNHDVKGWH